jgi:hypothetical protein
MDNKKVHALRSLTHSHRLCTPYVPYYSELSVLANKHWVFAFVGYSWGHSTGIWSPAGMGELATWLSGVH